MQIRRGSPGESVRMPRRSIMWMRDEKYHCAQYALGKVLQGPGEKQQNERDSCSGGDLCDLALAAGTFDHCGLGGAAVDDEGPPLRAAAALAAARPTKS